MAMRSKSTGGFTGRTVTDRGPAGGGYAGRRPVDLAPQRAASGKGTPERVQDLAQRAAGGGHAPGRPAATDDAAARRRAASPQTSHRSASAGRVGAQPRPGREEKVVAAAAPRGRLPQSPVALPAGDGGPGLVEPIVRVGPLDAEASAEGLILMLHGAGDSGEGMRDIAECWGQAMPRVAFLMPSAPVRGQMSSWFGKRPVTKEHPGPVLCRYKTVEGELLGLLETERQRLGLRFDQIALWGYSAGSMMAGWLTLLLPEACGALVLLHGLAPDKRLPLPPQRPASSSRGPCRPPALVLGGECDAQIPAAATRLASETLQKRWAFGDVTYVETPGQGHGIGETEYAVMMDFLAAHLCNETGAVEN